MRYRAFFSYARADDRIANWLHRQLDGYRTPKPLVGTDGELGPVPAKLHPIFRDRTDLESGGHVDAALQQALEESETLIVLCTPTSAKSHWVNHEVETFLKLGREAAIFPVIAAGVPDSGDPDTECFPPALRNKGLLAADLREIKLASGQLVGDGREGGRLKLTAGLLGVPLDKLVQRERRRQRQVVAALGAAALVFLGVAVFAGLQTLAANEQRNTARNTLYRFFATRAWDSIAKNDYGQAARYALAGMTLAPKNAEEYRAALSSAMHGAGEVEAVLHNDWPLKHIKFSPAGDRLLTLDEDGRLFLWDLSRRTARQLARGAKSPVVEFGFSSDGAGIHAAISREPNPVSWSAQDGALLDQPREGLHLSLDPEGVASLSPAPEVEARCGSSGEIGDFSRDGTRLLCFSPDGVIFVVDARSAKQLARTELTYEAQGYGVLRENIYSAEFSPDEALIVSREPGAVRVHNAATLEVINVLRGTEAVFSPDGKVLAVANDRRVEIFETVSLGRARPTPINALYGHADRVRGLAFSPDGARLASASEDGDVRFWTAIGGRQMARMDDFTQNAEIIARFGLKRESDQRPAGAEALSKAAQTVGCRYKGAALASSASHVLFSGDARICVVDRANGQAIVVPMRSNQRPVAALSTDGKFLVAPADPGSLQVIEIPSGRQAAVLNDAGVDISFLTFSPDGEMVVALDARGAMTLWRRPSSTPVKQFDDLKTRVRSALFTQDGSRLIVGLEDSATLVFDRRTLNRVSSFAEGSLYGAQTSRDGTRLFAQSGLVWDTTTGARMAELRGAMSTQERILLSEDQKYAATLNLSEHFQGYVWNVVRLTQGWGDLARDACAMLLGPGGRRFDAASIAADPLLTDIWSADRDVCEGVPGVPSIAELRRRAGLPAEPPSR